MLVVFSGLALATYPPTIAYGRDGDGNGWSLSIGIGPSGATASYVDSTPAGFSASISETINDNEICAVGLTSYGTTINCFFKNKKATSTGGNGALRTSTVGLSSTPSGGSGTSNEWGYGHVFLAAITNAVISDDQMLKLVANPWQLFSPRRIYIPTSTAAASTYTLSAATYAPGSITATGVTPRVTVTVA